MLPRRSAVPAVKIRSQRMVAAFSSGATSAIRVPRVWESNGRSTSAVQKTPKVQGRVQCLEAVVAALGPEDGAARTVIEAALQRARDEKPADQSYQHTRWTPDVVQERARVRVTRLEQALQAMGDLQCAEADMLQEALKRARQSAQERPLANQISECTRFIKRSTNGRRRWQLSKRHVPDWRVWKLNPRCAHEHCHQNRFGRGVEGEVSFHGTGARRGTGCASLQTASDVTHSHGPRRDPSTNPRFDDPRRIVILDGRPTRRVVRGHHSWGPGSHSETDVNDGRVRRKIESVVTFQDNARIVNARQGQRGVRVGEASHPGPSRRRRTQRLRALPWVWDSDSELEDDHRNVVPRRVDPFVPPDVVEALEQDLCHQ